MTSAVPPLRAMLDVDGVGSLELSPFARMFFSPVTWPDGQHYEASLRDVPPFTVEREPLGWIARNDRARLVLAIDEPVSLGALRATLRAIEVPLVRARVDGVALIDAPWPLTVRAPRRLGVLAGALVEVMDAVHHANLRAFDKPLAHLTAPDQRETKWVAVATRCEVPLRWLVEAGVTAPWNAYQVEETVVDLDGNIRRSPLAPDEPHRPYPALKRGFIHAGVVAGFFADRVREWRELEEQAAMLPSGGA